MTLSKGLSASLVKSVVKILAEEQGADEDTVMEKLLECGGVDFLMRGLASYGKGRKTHLPRAAARAVMFMMDPDNADMFPSEPWVRVKRKDETAESVARSETES